SPYSSPPSAHPTSTASSYSSTAAIICASEHAMKLRTAIALTLSALCTSALAQNFPSKPIRIVVAYPPGGPIDMVTRPLAQKMNEAMGVPVVVENRAGANGIVGADNVAKAPPDGYSLVVASGGLFAINPNVYAKMPFDTVKDFTPVS